MKDYKVRIADGSEIGPMDLQAVRNWYAQGLLEDSPVLGPGATHWAGTSSRPRSSRGCSSWRGAPSAP